MSFKPRLTKPEKGNKYYITKASGGWSPAIKGNPVDTDCDVLANCVGYALGRFNEIGNYGYCKYLHPVNAEKFLQNCDNLRVGSEPRLGACMVWKKGDSNSSEDGAGHVAIVERIDSNTQILTSESGYGNSKIFWTQVRKKGSGNWGMSSSYTFLGFIYNPATTENSIQILNQKVNNGMKYSDSNPPIKCMMTQSTCYQSTYNMQVKGVLWHSTGANNPNLARYVQPDDNAPDKDSLLQLIGKNRYKNDWNHIYRQAGLNAWIGKLASGTVATVQTMPWTYRPWGCGSGIYGSCNNGWIQFEICEDGLSDPNYFNLIYKEACELTAFLCKKFSIDPRGNILMNGIAVPTILCHADSCRLGLGSNHGDVLHWFPKFGKSMETVRADVERLMHQNSIYVGGSTSNSSVSNGSSSSSDSSEIRSGDLVTISSDAVYWSGKNIPQWIKDKKWYVYQVSANGRAIINEDELHQFKIMSPIDVKFLQKDGQIEADNSEKEEVSFTPFLVKVNVVLNYRAQPDINSTLLGTITNGGVYTIIAEQKDSRGESWGQLKGNSAWIMLKYTTKYSR